MKGYSKKDKAQLENFFQEFFLKAQPPLVFIRPIEAFLFQKYLPLKKPTLDFGCGDGFFTKTAFGKGKVDIGIDIAQLALKEAKRKRIYGKVTSYQSRRLPFKNGFFKTIVSNCVLEHVQDLDLIFAELNRVLEKNGLFLTTVATRFFPDYLFFPRLFRKFKLSRLAQIYINFLNRRSNHHHLLLPSDWIKRIESSGFKLVEKQGYLNNKKIMALFDLSHWLGIPSLVSKKFLGKWVVWPGLRKLVLKGFMKRGFLDISDLISSRKEPKPPYLFLAFRKK